MYGVAMTLKRGSGKAKCHLCDYLIGKNQPCIYISFSIKHQGYIHGIANECPAMIEGFKLKT